MLGNNKGAEQVSESQNAAPASIPQLCKFNITSHTNYYGVGERFRVFSPAWFLKKRHTTHSGVTVSADSVHMLIQVVGIDQRGAGGEKVKTGFRWVDGVGTATEIGQDSPTVAPGGGERCGPCKTSGNSTHGPPAQTWSQEYNTSHYSTVYASILLNVWLVCPNSSGFYRIYSFIYICLFVCLLVVFFFFTYKSVLSPKNKAVYGMVNRSYAATTVDFFCM